MNRLFDAIKKTNARLRKKQVNYLVKKKRFIEALKLVDDHSLNLGWLDRHIRDCAELQPLLCDYLAPQNTVERLRQVGIEAKRIDTDPILNGLVNIAARKHRISPGDRVIFEKIYTHQYHHAAQSEDQLFSTIDAADLCAPEFFGYYEGESFLSVFYQFLDIEPMSRTSFLEAKAQIAAQLWRQSDEARLQQLDSRQCFIEHQLDHPKHIEIIKNSCRNLDISYDLVENSLDLYRRSPKCIAHDDLSSGNICQAKDRFYLIDWDKWSISGIGAGLYLSRRELDMPLFEATITETAQFRDVTESLIRNNLYLFNIAKLAQQRSIGDLEYYLDKLRS